MRELVGRSWESELGMFNVAAAVYVLITDECLDPSDQALHVLWIESFGGPRLLEGVV